MALRIGSANNDYFLPKRMRINDLPSALRIVMFDQRNGGYIYRVMSAPQSGGGVKGIC